MKVTQAENVKCKKHEKADERWPFFFLTPFAKLNFRLS